LCSWNNSSNIINLAKSTKSIGGRDIWYNEDNSIICESNEESVLEAYESVKKKLFNREFNSKFHLLSYDIK